MGNLLFRYNQYIIINNTLPTYHSQQLSEANMFLLNVMKKSKQHGELGSLETGGGVGKEKNDQARVRRQAEARATPR